MEDYNRTTRDTVKIPAGEWYELQKIRSLHDARAELSAWTKHRLYVLSFVLSMMTFFLGGAYKIYIEGITQNIVKAELKDIEQKKKEAFEATIEARVATKRAESETESAIVSVRDSTKSALTRMNALVSRTNYVISRANTEANNARETADHYRREVDDLLARLNYVEEQLGEKEGRIQEFNRMLASKYNAADSVVNSKFNSARFKINYDLEGLTNRDIGSLAAIEELNYKLVLIEQVIRGRLSYWEYTEKARKVPEIVRRESRKRKANSKYQITVLYQDQTTEKMASDLAIWLSRKGYKCSTKEDADIDVITSSLFRFAFLPKLSLETNTFLPQWDVPLFSRFGMLDTLDAFPVWPSSVEKPQSTIDYYSPSAKSQANEIAVEFRKRFPNIGNVSLIQKKPPKASGAVTKSIVINLKELPKSSFGNLGRTR